jgi:hypothetical protein
MPTVKRRASAILCAFHDAKVEFVGKAVVLSVGKAGDGLKHSLDEAHGLRISIRGHTGRWPVSTIKFAQDSSTEKSCVASSAPASTKNALIELQNYSDQQ